MRQITKNGRPSLKQIRRWCKDKNHVVFKHYSGKVQEGTIKNCWDGGELIVLSDHPEYEAEVERNDIASFTYFSKAETIFTDTALVFDESTKMIKETQVVDVILPSQPEPLMINKAIIGSRSPYFGFLLTGGMKETAAKTLRSNSFFSEQELDVLIKMMDWNDMVFLNNAAECLYLLDALDKIAYKKDLKIEIKNTIFELITLTDYYQLMENYTSFGQLGRQFLNHIKEELRNYCNRERSPITDEILKWTRKEKELHFIYRKEWNGDRSNEMPTLYGDRITRIINLLQIGGFTLEHLSLYNTPMMEMKAVFDTLINHKTIKTFTSTWISTTPRPDTPKKDIKELLLFMDTAPQLERVELRTVDSSRTNIQEFPLFIDTESLFERGDSRKDGEVGYLGCLASLPYGVEGEGYRSHPENTTRPEKFIEQRLYTFLIDAYEAFNLARERLEKRQKNTTLPKQLTSESIFIEKISASGFDDPNEVILRSGNKSFTINKEILGRRSAYFKDWCSKQITNDELIDLSGILAEQELEIVLKMLDCHNNLSFLKTAEETLYLLDGLAKITYPNISQEELKQIIFKVITLADYYQLIEKQDQLGALGKEFLINIKEEVRNYCECVPSVITEKVLKEISKEKKLTLIHQFNPERNIAVRFKGIQLYGDEMARVITLLVLGGFNLEQLELRNTPITEMKAVFACLMNHKRIQSVKTEWSYVKYGKALEQPDVSLEDIAELLLFMKNAPQLQQVCLGTTGEKDEIEGEGYRSYCKYFERHGFKIKGKEGSYTFLKDAFNAFNAATKKLQQRQMKISQGAITFFHSQQPNKKCEDSLCRKIL